MLMTIIITIPIITLCHDDDNSGGKSGNKIVYYFLWLWFFTWDNLLEMWFGRIALHDQIRVILILMGIKITFDVLFRCYCPIPDSVYVKARHETIDYCSHFNHLNLLQVCVIWFAFFKFFLRMVFKVILKYFLKKWIQLGNFIFFRFVVCAWFFCVNWIM